MGYRPDLDGLRAIAILLVLLFHCEFKNFSGGYVGVDVFFVISGYLITSLILADLENGVFSFSKFYKRRIRRLVPALLVTILVTLLGATVIMTPEHLVETAKSGGWAAISLSNFYFAKLASYFDSSGQEKPFLHMWSLSLEEQFYMLWPTILFLLHRWKRKQGIAFLIVAGIPIGLAASQLWIASNPNHAYFLLPTRGFQFLMGASCIWLSQIHIRGRVLNGAISAGGLLLIFVPAMLYSDKTAFPGLAAAVPSVGTMLVILEGKQPAMQRLLGNRVMVWFGKISYSTYLVHWPIVVFGLYLAIEPPALAGKIVLFLCSVAAGQLLDSMVAQRFRYVRGETGGNWWFAASQFAMVGLIGAFAWTTVATGGLPRRFTFVPEVAEYRHESLFPFLQNYADGVLHIRPTGRHRVLIFGDSMVQNYVPALVQLDGIREARVDLITRGGCVLAEGAVLVNYGSLDRDCLRLRDYLYGLDDRYDLVVWSQNWLGYSHTLNWRVSGAAVKPAFLDAADFNGWREGIERTIEHFESRAGKIVVIGPPVMVEVNPILQRIGPLTNISGIAAQLPQMRETPMPDRDSIEEGIRVLVTSKPNTLYIDPRSIICDGAQCHWSEGRFSYYLDSLHNTSAAIPRLRNGLEHAGVRF